MIKRKCYTVAMGHYYVTQDVYMCTLRHLPVFPWQYLEVGRRYKDKTCTTVFYTIILFQQYYFWTYTLGKVAKIVEFVSGTV